MLGGRGVGRSDASPAPGVMDRVQPSVRTVPPMLVFRTSQLVWGRGRSGARGSRALWGESPDMDDCDRPCATRALRGLPPDMDDFDRPCATPIDVWGLCCPIEEVGLSYQGCVMAGDPPDDMEENSSESQNDVARDDLGVSERTLQLPGTAGKHAEWILPCHPIGVARSGMMKP